VDSTRGVSIHGLRVLEGFEGRESMFCTMLYMYMGDVGIQKLFMIELDYISGSCSARPVIDTDADTAR
jgi:hypothetical protein